MLRGGSDRTSVSVVVSAFNGEQRVSGVVKRVCGVLGDLTFPHETIVNVLMMISGKIFLDIFCGQKRNYWIE